MHAFPARGILVPTDLTETSEPALLFAGHLHSQFGGEVRLLHSYHVDLPPYFLSSQIEDLKRRLVEAAADAADHARRQGARLLGFEPAVSVTGEPAVEAILGAAELPSSDLVIMGTHGRRGVDRLWLGSVAERVLRASPKPVLAVRPGMAPTAWANILCPTAQTGVSRTALEYAGLVAQATGGLITVLHAVEPGALPPDCSLVPDTVRARCRIREVTHHGDAPGVILATAREMGPDVIVMGGQRRTSLFGTLFSSTTERVMQLAEAPLVIVPEPV